MQITKDRFWIRFGVPKQSSSYTGDLSGKYLFFAEDQSLLLELAQEELRNHEFEIAKISRDNRSGDYVCCLYWTDDSRKAELFKRYQDRDDIKYRWWKSNADTRAGKYSQRFRGEA